MKPKHNIHKYIDLKNARYGDVIFFEPYTLSGDIIRKIDGSPYSHVAIFWGYIGGQPYMFEAQRNKSIGLTKVQDWINFIILRPSNRAWLKKPEELMQIEGRSYQTNKLVAIALHKLLGVSLEEDDPNSMICSELVNWAYNYVLGEKGNCTPASLFETLK